MTQLMRGPERLREIVAIYLANTMPELLTVAREQYGREFHQLPDPAKYDAYEPYAADEYPVIGLYVVSDRNLVRVDYSDKMEEEYWTTYSARIFATIKSPSDENDEFDEPVWDWTIRCRDEMTTVLRACLLSQQSLGYPDECQIQEETLTTDYPDPVITNTQAKRYVATGVIALEIKLMESLYRNAIGTANQINVNPALLD